MSVQRLKQINASNDELEIIVVDQFGSLVVFQFIDNAAWAGTLTFYGSLDDGVTYVAIQATNLGSGTAATTATTPGLYRVDTAGLTRIKVVGTGVTAGLDVFARIVTG